MPGAASCNESAVVGAATTRSSFRAMRCDAQPRRQRLRARRRGGRPGQRSHPDLQVPFFWFLICGGHSDVFVNTRRTHESCPSSGV